MKKIAAYTTLFSAFAFATNVSAAVTTYNDEGLEFTINDNDPYAATIAFSDKSFVLAPVISAPASESILSTETIYQPFPLPPVVNLTYTDFTLSVLSANTSVSEITALGLTSNIAPDNAHFGQSFSDPAGFSVFGQWSLSSPTETVIGDYRIFLNPSIYYLNMPSVLDASLYPSSVSLDRGLTIGAYPYSFVIPSDTIDGFVLDLRLFPSFSATSTGGASLIITPIVAPVPVPAAAWLFGSGLMALVGMAKRKA